MPPPQLQARRGQLGGVDGRDSARLGGRGPGGATPRCCVFPPALGVGE